MLAVVAGSGVALRHQFHPTQVKNTAKKASSTMTRKIACTTADVVRRPTCSASDSTSMPWKQPAIAMIAPKTGALIRPMYRSVIGTTSRMRWMNVTGGISSDAQASRQPPMIAISDE
ncbi:hypothetical protein WR25_26797 [Diploscapter pachys]|uniref:Uncharacterized protein n=1 Tax=Diploscapter pachys TaxID=2018661 RepID=A0A2A2M5V3_9BILA|nr:hypothetical protein WR25_26797 [Diploscapter pachys]